MATLLEAIRTAQQEPDSERSQMLKEAIISGKMDDIAEQEGIDLTAFKSHVQRQNTQTPREKEISTEMQTIPSEKSSIEELVTMGLEAPKKPRPEKPPKQKDFLGEALDFASAKLLYPFLPSEIGKGARKGVLSTVSGMAELGQRGLGAATEAFGVPKAEVKTLPDVLGAAGMEREAAEGVITPETPLEQLGFTGEQISEFFLPGGAATKVGKAAGLSKFVSKMPRYLQKFLPGAAAVATEAIGAGTVAAIQEGEIGKEAGIAAIAGGLGRGLAPIVTKVGQKFGGSLINTLIKPKKTGFAFGKNPGLEVSKAKITATSMDDLLSKVIKQKRSVGVEIGKKLEKIDDKFADANKIIDDATKKFTQEVTDPTAARAFQNAMDQIKFETKFVEGKIVKVGEKNLKKITPFELHKIQKKVGNLTKWTGQAYEKELNQTLSKVYRKLGKKLDDMVPGTKLLQRKYANFLEAEKATQSSMESSHLKKLIFGVSQMGAGGLTGLAIGGETPEERVKNIVLGMIIPKVGATPAVRTQLARLLSTDVMAVRSVIPYLSKEANKAIEQEVDKAIEQEGVKEELKRKEGEDLAAYLERIKGTL